MFNKYPLFVRRFAAFMCGLIVMAAITTISERVRKHALERTLGHKVTWSEFFWTEFVLG